MFSKTRFDDLLINTNSKLISMIEFRHMISSTFENNNKREYLRLSEENCSRDINRMSRRVETVRIKSTIHHPA